FYSKCRQISLILKPIKELTNILEARNTNLAECFVGLVKLGASINQVDSTNRWKSLIITNFNLRFEEFINNIYILAYWLHLLYRGLGLKREALNKIYKTALLIWYNLGHTESLCLSLLTELKIWKRQEAPYNLSYNQSKESPIKCSNHVQQIENSENKDIEENNDLQETLSTILSISQVID
ncbi:5672_t:CDS:2, partial [Gigaspora rosea]